MVLSPGGGYARSTLGRVTERRQEFEHDLESIEGKVIELFAMVAEDLPTATQALLNCDGEALTALIERESAARLARLGGTEPEIAAVPRRRSDPA